MIAFSEYRYHLLKLKGFDNIFKLIFIYLELNLNTRLNDDKLIEYLNIFSKYSIEDVVNQAEKDILAFISELLRNNEKIKNINYFLNEAYTKIVLSNIESFNLNNSDETKEIRKFYDCEDFSAGLIRLSAENDKGFVRMKSYSNPFVVPVQIDLFQANSKQGN